MLKFDADTRTRISDTVTLDFDPTGSTVELKVDSTWYDATWLDTPVECNGKWTQVALTDDYFAGPEVENPGDAVVLTSGVPRHHTRTRVTLEDDIISGNSTTIEVGVPRFTESE